MSEKKHLKLGLFDFNSNFVQFYTEVKSGFRINQYFIFQQRCHCEREQRAKQSAKYKFDFFFVLAEFQAIIKFFAKMKQNTAKVW